MKALKSFILTSLKFKVAPYPIIVSLDTLKSLLASCRSFLPCSTHTCTYTPFSNTIMNKMQ